ncbi:hypothetical protein F5Y16DRAFT_409945 [Xylariaceae sp. FL0255]|nr:hypothetical protein F5Y16DRAFT_409945 [Xylariaceae sp. FL0255]
MAATQFMTPLTQPHSRLHGSWFPAVAAHNFQGWKQIDVRGKPASRSSGDLQSLRMVWASPESSPVPTPAVPEEPARHAPQQSFIERLPTELKIQIIDYLILDVPPEVFKSRNSDLMAMLLTSKSIHAATLFSLYKNITIPHSRIFRKFLTHVAAKPDLGTMVQRMDFSHFNPTAQFFTLAERNTTRNLTSETLLQSLDLTPNLREFLGQEYVDDDIDVNVLRKLFFGLGNLQGLDFCASASASFRTAFESLVSEEWPESLSISRLSLHRCMNLPASVYETILPRLHRLTHLDVAGTRITDRALMSIPKTARITHLNLAKCKFLTSAAVIDFITNHPAAKELVFLSLASDYRSHELLDSRDLHRLIPVLPSTLRSLSLKGSKMESRHISMLRLLTKHLEELSLGRGLTLSDVNRLFQPDDDMEQVDWVPHTLKYLDLSDYPLNSLNMTVLFSNSSLLRPFSEPLEVVEFAEDAYKRLEGTTATTRAGWRTTTLNSRSWLVRNCTGPRDHGARDWKMGATFWGMRKVPIAVANVGGMYGSYMFQRHL